ncbi:TRAP transporter small permease [Piscinibacter sp.]|uniref:TRAP transporter small permease n=1 Tax=Piscinibacter sp. TaxID=1903157 RepID=UPI001B7C63FF|nr:TRAP transporter small permease [Piscinibacter sp.]MBK7529485.1 TRAP transporter small permease [Piscinibacter sp.]MBL0093161.1 TRAP transporter small permease [Piscinibacter sp.]MBP6544298.1 TRAP transporter small permease [Piscinibacter sp.]
MYSRFCAALARLCLRVGVGGLVLLIVAVIYQVIGRYVFNDTPTWAESGAVLLVLYVTMLGMAVGVRDAGHIGLESLLVLAPEKLRLKMELLIHALVLLFGIVMAWQCTVLALSVAGYKIPTLGVSEAFKYAPPALAGVLVAMFSIEHILALLRGVEVEPAWH